jgi:hypothetical protein
MPVKPIRNIVPKTQISATGAAWTAGFVLDISSKFPTRALANLYLGLYGDNVTDEALDTEIINELVSKIYLWEEAHGSILDLSGLDYFMIQKFFFGRNQLPLFGDVVDNAERYLVFPLTFEHPKFAGTGFPSTAAGKAVLQITLGTSSNIDGADYDVYGEFALAEPTTIITALTQNYTPTQTNTKLKIPLRAAGRCAGILLYGTTVRTTIQSAKLWINDAEQGYEVNDLLAKGISALRNNFGDLYRKFAIYEKVPAAATDGGPASLPAAVEWIKNAMNYTWLDFTDDPLDVAGKKFELEMVFGDTNPVRIIPVELIAV